MLVDHGLMRLGEAQKVVTMFRESYNIPLVHVNASDTFLKALEGVEDPEVKRKTIGKLFIDVFEQEARKSEAPILLRKARSTRTLSRVCPSPAGPRSPSSRTTTSVACPSACT